MIAISGFKKEEIARIFENVSFINLNYDFNPDKIGVLVPGHLGSIEGSHFAGRMIFLICASRQVVRSNPHD
jgi:hypothetical protein